MNFLRSLVSSCPSPGVLVPPESAFYTATWLHFGNRLQMTRLAQLLLHGTQASWAGDTLPQQCRRFRCRGIDTRTQAVHHSLFTQSRCQDNRLVLDRPSAQLLRELGWSPPFHPQSWGVTLCCREPHKAQHSEVTSLLEPAQGQVVTTSVPPRPLWRPPPPCCVSAHVSAQKL